MKIFLCLTILADFSAAKHSFFFSKKQPTDKVVSDRKITQGSYKIDFPVFQYLKITKLVWPETWHSLSPSEHKEQCHYNQWIKKQDDPN